MSSYTLLLLDTMSPVMCVCIWQFFANLDDCQDTEELTGSQH
jgi:hypothetical protein